MTLPRPDDNPVGAATATLAARYAAIIADATRTGVDPAEPTPRLSLANLVWMCDAIVADAQRLPLDKTSRWLGFIQGCLAMRGLIDVDEERDVSRPLFHAAYAATGTVAPESLAMPSDDAGYGGRGAAVVHEDKR